jgi:hypothetical protein
MPDFVRLPAYADTLVAGCPFKDTADMAKGVPLTILLLAAEVQESHTG